MQQLGRGLRKSKGKEYLNVLDFIGNYEKAGRVRFLLAGANETGEKNYRGADRIQVPDDCLIDFDMKLIDLFSEMDKKNLRIREQIQKEYFRIRDLLQRRPTRMDLITYMDDEIYQMAISHSKDNPFKRYLEFLCTLDDLEPDEKGLYQGIGREFISLIENTNMTRVYKMPVLMAFYNHGHIRMEVSNEELLISWKEFFSKGTNWKDIDSGMSYEEYCQISDQEHLKKIWNMPIHYLLKSGKGFLLKKDNENLMLREEMREIIKNPAFVEQMGDAIEYRMTDYYRRRYKEKCNIDEPKIMV